MTETQFNDLRRVLGEVEVTQVNGSPANVHVPFVGGDLEPGEVDPHHHLTGELPPLKELVKSFDEVAVVLPIGLLQQLLPFAGSGRLLQSLNKRLVLEGGKVQFVHDKWQAVKEVRIVTEDL
jgi:hypothetical protein